MTNNERFQRGWERLMELDSDRGKAVITGFKEIAPELGNLIVEFAYHDIYLREPLDLRQRQLITISSLATLGGCEAQVEFHISAGLNVGLNANEVVEALLHIAPFAGFPRVINAMNVLKRLIAERNLKIETSEAVLFTDRFKHGWEKLMEVDGEGGKNVVDSFKDIAPDLGKYIVEFTFGDIYNRAGLDLKLRQMVTIASLLSLGGCEPQLHVHINAGLNVGLTPTEVVEIILHCIPYTGFPRVINAMNVAKHVYAERNVKGGVESI